MAHPHYSPKCTTDLCVTVALMGKKIPEIGRLLTKNSCLHKNIIMQLQIQEKYKQNFISRINVCRD